jgi:DNA-binding winged helix-turn-helix (wHTH) protein
MNDVRIFGPFRFDLATGEIRRGDTVVRLPNQPARMLDILTGRQGELVTRGELRRVLWPSDTFVDFDGCLNYCARRIRAALGDEAGTPTYLQTVPRRGYRFIASVHVERPAAPVLRRVQHKHLPRRLGVTAAAVWLGLACGLVVGHAAEASPWHDQVVHWIHLRLGPVPGLCSRL